MSANLIAIPCTHDKAPLRLSCRSFSFFHILYPLGEANVRVAKFYRRDKISAILATKFAS